MDDLLPMRVSHDLGNLAQDVETLGHRQGGRLVAQEVIQELCFGIAPEKQNRTELAFGGWICLDDARVIQVFQKAEFPKCGVLDDAPLLQGALSCDHVDSGEPNGFIDRDVFGQPVLIGTGRTIEYQRFQQEIADSPGSLGGPNSGLLHGLGKRPDHGPIDG